METALVDVRSLVASMLGADALSRVSDDELIFQTGVIDSLMLVELITAFETRFRVRVESQELAPENFESMAAMAAYLTRKRGD
jgi:acyl carrier protein